MNKFITSKGRTCIATIVEKGVTLDRINNRYVVLTDESGDIFTPIDEEIREVINFFSAQPDFKD